jgi:hypothetical protein
MTVEEWVEAFAEKVGLAPPDAAQVDDILRLAAVAAHSSERQAAPIVCWLAGTTGRPIAELRAVAEEMEQGD